jgi:riboflavin-specific deaminase-like protein
MALLGPLLAPPSAADGCVVLGRLAQSLDGYIATRHGDSHWISGEEDIAHTHRLRAMFDAVVVGAGTVRADNPQLTTRLVEGPSPVRVVLDPACRLGGRYRVFDGGPPTLLLCAPDADARAAPGAAEVVPVARDRDGLDPGAIVTTLASRGLRRIFIEGGGITVARFLSAGMLDRLHITVAPLLIGGGIPAFPLPAAEPLSEGRRFRWSAHRMGHDLLLDIALTSRRRSPARPV